MVKFGLVRGPSSDHSGLGSTPKLNFNVKVTPACAADTQTEVLVVRGAPERGLPALVGHVSVGGGRVFLQVLVVLGATEKKAVAGPGVRSVGIHDDVGVVGCLDEKLHEEPARPAVVASRLVQACDLVVLVHGSHVPETRVKVRVPAGRTFMQDRVKRNRGQAYLV